MEVAVKRAEKLDGDIVIFNKQVFNKKPKPQPTLAQKLVTEIAKGNGQNCNVNEVHFAPVKKF